MDRLNTWEKRTEMPLTIGAVIFLGAYAIPIIWPDIPASLQAWCESAIWLTWGSLVLDYFVRLFLAPDKMQFISRNVLDLLAVTLPALRPLRLLRLIALVSVLHRVGTHSLRGKVVTYAVGSTLLLVFIAGLAITEAERNVAGSTINTAADGWWWAIATITTVGYGDKFPVTLAGKAIATALMICGIALLGVVTATVASWLVDKVAAAQEDQQAATRAQVAELSREVAMLRAELEATRKATDDQ